MSAAANGGKKLENQIESGQDAATRSAFVGFVHFIAPYVALCLLVAAWWFASHENARIFPSPAIVLDKLWHLLWNKLSGSTLFGHIGISMLRIFVALFFAIVIGVPFGVLIGWSPVFRATFGALFECVRPIPVLAWIPLVIMWFGLGERAKTVMIFVGSFMPIVVNSYTGIKMVSPIYLDVGRMFNAATQKQLLMKIVLPAALPTIFAGIRNATSVAWMVVLAAEMLAAKTGLGFIISRGMEVFDIALVMTGMVCIGVAGAFLALLTNLVERKVCPWNRALASE